MRINNRVIRKQLRQLLREFGMDGDATVARDDHCRSLVTTDRSGGGVDLVYHPKFLGLMGTLSDLQLSLKHELCHLHTCPTSVISAPSSLEGFMLAAFLEYADLFREYLAEREYERRFGVDRDYLSLRRRMFLPDRALLEALKGFVGRSRTIDAVFLGFGGVFRTFHNAACFYVGSDATFHEWCRIRNVQSLYQFFLYTMEDMDQILEEDVAYLEKLDLVSDSFKCAVNIYLQGLLQNQALSVVVPLDEIPELNPKIAALWKSRRVRLASRKPTPTATRYRRVGS